MDEARRREMLGQMPVRGGQSMQQQIQVDLKNAVQKACKCGSKYFIPVVAVYTVSALVSPTGQELVAQQPVLICLDCKQPIGDARILEDAVNG